MRAMDSELVFVPKIACSGAASSTWASRLRLSSSFSGTASITRSAPATASARFDTPESRGKAASRASGVTLPRATPLSRLLRIEPRAESTCAWDRSNNRAVRPERAVTWAIPRPIVPAPSTATVASFMVAPAVWGDGA